MPKGEEELKIKLSCSGATFPSPDYSWMKFQLLGTQHSPGLGMEPSVWQGPMGSGACGGAGGTWEMARREGGKDTGARGGEECKEDQGLQERGTNAVGTEGTEAGREGDCRGVDAGGTKGMDAGGTKGAG